MYTEYQKNSKLCYFITSLHTDKDEQYEDAKVHIANCEHELNVHD